MGLFSVAQKIWSTVSPKLPEVDLAVSGTMEIRTSLGSPVSDEGLHNSLANILDRLEVVERNSQDQADLIVHLTSRNANLARSLLVLAVVAVVSSGIAIASLVLVIL